MNDFTDMEVHDNQFSSLIVRSYLDKNNVQNEWGMIHFHTLGRTGLVASVTEDG